MKLTMPDRMTAIGNDAAYETPVGLKPQREVTHRTLAAKEPLG